MAGLTGSAIAPARSRGKALAIFWSEQTLTRPVAQIIPSNPVHISA